MPSRFCPSPLELLPVEMPTMFRYAAFLTLLLLAEPQFAQVPSRQGPVRRGSAEEVKQPASMKMRVQQERVTAEIRFTPLHRVLEELAAWTGVVFEVESQDNTPVSVRLNGLPVEAAVERITQNSDSVFYYDRGVQGESRVSYVRIFSRTNRNAPPSLRYIGSGKVTKTEADLVDSPEQALAILQKGGNVEARQKAIEVLVESKDAAAVGALTQVLQDPAAELKVAAIEGLASLGARAALPEILKALRDSHPGVRQSAVVAVSLIGDADHVRNLRPLAKDRDASVAAAADAAIRKLARQP
jgi:hypothetical protein